MRFSKTLFCAAAMAFAPSAASAGGFDLTGQPIGIIFEEGNYVEATIGIGIPDVEGSNPTGGFGNVAEKLPFFTGGVKTDFTDRISGAVIFDRPFLRRTDYTQGLFTGTSADVEATTITAVGRFKFNENFSVYGGPRLQRGSIDLTGPSALPGFPRYAISVKDNGYGFVVGAAAEIPEYRMRAAVTYNSEIDHDFDSVETFTTPLGTRTIPGSVDVHTPQSINLDLQTGLPTNTLLIANIRWAEWDGVDLDPPGFRAATGRPVVEYTENVFTYRLTAVQKLNEEFAAFVTGSYEADGGEAISLFKTVDGGTSLGGGIIYKNDDGLTLALGGEYAWLEGTSGVQAPGTPPSSFDASSVNLRFKVGYNF